MFLINSAMVNIDLATAGLASVLGYAVVFIGLILLMAVVALVGRALSPREKEEAAPASAPAPAAAAPVAAAPVAAAPAASAPARGTAGELKLHDVSPKDAALIMAVVAYKSGKPLNQLRFKSIKEVK